MFSRRQGAEGTRWELGGVANKRIVLTSDEVTGDDIPRRSTSGPAWARGVTTSVPGPAADEERAGRLSVCDLDETEIRAGVYIKDGRKTINM